MPGAHRKSSHNDEKTADGGSYTLSSRSLEHNNYEICSKDCPVTALVLRDSDGRYIILTLVTSELDERWKLLAPFFLPVHGFDRRKRLGPGAHVNVDRLEKVSPSANISSQIDLQKEQMTHPPKCTGFAKSFIASSSSGANVMRQSRNRNKWTKSVKNSSGTCLQNSFISNTSSGLLCDGSNRVVSDVLVDDIPKVDKPVKKNSRKKAKKKGKPYKKSLHRKGSIELKALSEESICGVSVSETSFTSNPLCSVEHISENNLSVKATSSSLPVQVTMGKVDSEGSGSDVLNPPATPATYMSCSDEVDESERTASLSDEFAREDFSCNQSCLDESSTNLSNNSSAEQTSEAVLSTFNGNTTNARTSNHCDISSDFSSGQYNAPMLDSHLDCWNSDNSASSGFDMLTQSWIKEDSKCPREGATVLGTSNNGTALQFLTANSCEINLKISNDGDIYSPDCSNDLVDTDVTDRTCCNSQACSSNTFNPALPGKRGRHSRKVSGSSYGVNRLGSANTYPRTRKDINYSVWQRVQKNNIEECICETSPVSPQYDIASHGSENRLEIDSCLWMGQNESGELGRFPCLDEMAADSDSSGLAANIVDSTEYLSKFNGKLVNNIPENLKRKSESVPKQDLSHYSCSDPQTGKTNTTLLSKIHVQQKEASKISLPVNYDKSYTVALRSPCNGDFQRVGVTPTDKADSCLSEQQTKAQYHVNETTHTGNFCGTIRDMTSQATKNQIIPSSRTLDSLDMKCVLEVNSDRSDVKFHKDMHHNLYHLADNEGVGCVRPENGGSHAEYIKQENNFAPVFQKWIPVGKRDAAPFNTSHINPSVTNRSQSKGIEVESSSVHHFLPLSHNSKNVDCSAPEEEGLTNKLGYNPLYMSRESNGVHFASGCHSSTQEAKEQSISDFEKDLNKIIQVVQDAYRLQTASESVHLATGSPVAEFERLLHSASPVLGQVYSIQICKSCTQDQLIGDSLCQHQIPNISLRNLWQWYEKPGNYGLEVKAEDHHYQKRLGNDRFEFRAYFVPYLSAVQLFGRSSSASTINGISDGKMGKDCDADNMSKNSSLSTLPIFSMLLPRPRKEVVTHLPESPSSSSKDETCNHSASRTCLGAQELLFEYFESDQPQQRRPFFEKIKELVMGNNTFSNSHIFGDPSKLECLNVHDLHPASWFSVAWYPIYRIPDGNFRAAFLTYHSLGHFIHRSALSNFSDEVTHIVSPVVGLQSYNAKEECWFRQTQSKSQATQTEESSSLNPSEILKERLGTLERTASAMARASVCKGDVRSVNRQPDYEFFLSRRR